MSPCLAVVQVLDVHKNLITTLPGTIGKLSALQKVDLSENKINELPAGMCELREDLQLSVARNPLERPPIEQARQGVGAIRKFFNYRAVETAFTNTLEQIPKDLKWHQSPNGGKEPKAPTRQGQTASRHDWAAPGSSILLFNCKSCPIGVTESFDASLISDESEPKLIAEFNQQCVGCLRKAAPGSNSNAIQDRIEFFDVWMPWRNQSGQGGEELALLIEMKGRRKAGLYAKPWLAFGCSIGARFKMQNGFCTVSKIREDDNCEVVRDSASDQNASKKKNDEVTTEFINPTPTAMSRANSVAYKAGQKVMILHEGRFVDAVVDAWHGLRCGSRHVVRLSSSGASAAASATPQPTGRARRTSSAGVLRTIEIDLNETNHARLVVSTVAKYETMQKAYFESVLTKHTIAHDAATDADLPAIEQRVFLVQSTPDSAQASSVADAAGDDPARDDAATGPPAPSSAVAKAENPFSALSIADTLASPAANTAPSSIFVRVQSTAEQDLLQAQIMFSLARTAVSAAANKRRQVSVLLPLGRLIDMAADDNKRASLSEMIIAVLSMDHPNSADVFRQAMELRSLVIVAEARNADLVGLKDASLLEELCSYSIIFIASNEALSRGPAEVVPLLYSLCNAFEGHSLGLYYNESPLGSGNTKALLQHITNGSLHYGRVVALHVSRSEFVPETMQPLCKLLSAKACNLTSLDVSRTSLSVPTLIDALKTNATLTSLDLREVPEMRQHYKSLGELLLSADSKCRLAFLRCNAFELLERQTSLNLFECPMDEGSVCLLGGLLQNNSTLQELHLGATGMLKTWAVALFAALGSNSSLTTLHLTHNASIDEPFQDILRTSAQERQAKSANMHLTLRF